MRVRGGGGWVGIWVEGGADRCLGKDGRGGTVRGSRRGEKGEGEGGWGVWRGVEIVGGGRGRGGGTSYLADSGGTTSDKKSQLGKGRSLMWKEGHGQRKMECLPEGPGSGDRAKKQWTDTREKK